MLQARISYTLCQYSNIVSWLCTSLYLIVTCNGLYFQTAIHFGLINMNHINDFCHISWNTKNYHTVRMVPKSQRKIVEGGAQLLPLTHIYITVHSPGLIQRL